MIIYFILGPPLKFYIDTKNNDLEKVTPLEYGFLGYLFVKFAVVLSHTLLETN